MLVFRVYYVMDTLCTEMSFVPLHGQFPVTTDPDGIDPQRPHLVSRVYGDHSGGPSPTEDVISAGVWACMQNAVQQSDALERWRR